MGIFAILVLTGLQAPQLVRAKHAQRPSQVEGVSVSRTLQSSSTTFILSWNSLDSDDITYTVCYSANSGTDSNPPSGADCSTSGLTGTSTTLNSLSSGTTYYMWVNAVSGNERGQYSDRVQERTYAGGYNWTPSIDHVYISSMTANSRPQDFLYYIKFNIITRTTSQFQSFRNLHIIRMIRFLFQYSCYRISITPDHHSHITCCHHSHITHCHYSHTTHSPHPRIQTKYHIKGTDPNSNFISDLTFPYTHSPGSGSQSHPTASQNWNGLDFPGSCLG